MRLQSFKSAKAGRELASSVTSTGNIAHRTWRTMLKPSCPGLSRLRGRSPFGEAQARASTSSLRACCEKDVDGRDERGHDGECSSCVITCGSAFRYPGW